jgi:hypothetical protein
LWRKIPSEAIPIAFLPKTREAFFRNRMREKDHRETLFPFRPMIVLRVIGLVVQSDQSFCLMLLTGHFLKQTDSASEKTPDFPSPEGV